MPRTLRELICISIYNFTNKTIYLSKAVWLKIWSDGFSGAKSVEKKTYTQRGGNRELLTAQTYIENIKIDFVKTDALWDFAKVF